ncbi:MAG: hypothetical protein AB7G37_02445 [Solirubrobacteraceae bacterium]
MPVASAAADVLTIVLMAIVIGMAGLLIQRGTRSRPEDRDPDEQDRDER